MSSASTPSSSTVDHATAHRLLDAIPRTTLSSGGPTPVESLARLREALRLRARLFVKRDDALTFGGGGNKVRKLEVLAARAVSEGADTLVTMGSVQSNHARATAATAARLGLQCVLILSGEQQLKPTGNALLMPLFGAHVEYVPDRASRAPHMRRVLDRLQAEQRRPFAIPLGASTPLGALGYARAVGELLTQIPAPDVIIHASSSGGTQAGLMAGCALFGLHTRVIGMSVDEPAEDISRGVSEILRGIGPELSAAAGAGVAVGASAGAGAGTTVDLQIFARREVEVDDRFVDGGYAVSGPLSREALTLTARTEGLLLDPVYSAKAMAGLIAYARTGALDESQTILFWHTGGIPGLFA